MGYLYLFLAIFSEIAATSCLKLSQGFSRLLPTVICLLCYLLSFWGLSRTLLLFNLNLVYATWCGLGILGTTLIAWLYFKESLSLSGLIGIVLIIAGVVLLNVPKG